jgi:hypothetical protein
MPNIRITLKNWASKGSVDYEMSFNRQKGGNVGYWFAAVLFLFQFSFFSHLN